MRIPRAAAASLAIAVILVGLLVAAPTASAHARLVSSQPAAGQVLADPPARLVLTFGESVEPAGTHAQLTNATGSHFEGAPGDQAVDPGNSAVLIVDLSRHAPLPQGAYVVTWTSLSVDGDSLDGTYTFIVGNASQAAAAANATAHPHSGWFAQAALYSGILIPFGMMVFAWLIVPKAWAGEGVLSTRRILAEAAAIVAIAGIVGAVYALGDILARSSVDARAFLTSTTAGPLMLGRLVLLMAAAGLLWTGSGKDPKPDRMRYGGIALALALLATGLTSHAYASTTNRSIGVASDLVHLASASVWVGGVIGLLVLIPRLDTDATKRAFVAFGRFALPALVITIATGTLNAVLRVGSVQALLHDAYGWTILTKLGLWIALLGFGAFHRLRSIPTLGLLPGQPVPRTIVRVLASEALTMLGVLLATGILTTLTPPAG